MTLSSLLQYRDSYAELELRYESAVLEIEHLHEMLKVAKAGEVSALPSLPSLVPSPATRLV